MGQSSTWCNRTFTRLTRVAIGVFIVFPSLFHSEVRSSEETSSGGTEPFTLVDGFVAELVADDRLVHDSFVMTLNSNGNPVLSGPNYIKTLFDDNGDGVYDRSVLWSNLPKQGAQGIWAEENKVYWVGDGGLWVSEDSNGDHVADKPPRMVFEIATGGEHDAHAIRRGPDGYWYLIVGNFAKNIARLQNDPNAPVARPRGGTIWRISPDFKTRGVWAHGIRNCYDFDFLPSGQIVSFESDCERESTFPWYRPTRVMVFGPGSDAGWCGLTWKDHDNYITMPQVIGSMGRGSPTGVTVYDHSSYPERYRGAAFVLDWTFGRVIAIYPNRNLPEDKQATGRLPAEIFMQTNGVVGFAPTDICQAPDGSLLVCIGGRGTAGSVYRIRYVGESTPAVPSKEKGEKELKLLSGAVAKETVSNKTALAVEKALLASAPWESWSESEWRVGIDRSAYDCLLRIVTGEVTLDSPSATGVPLRAAQILTRLRVAVPELAIERGLKNPSSQCHAGIWWLIGRGEVNKLPTESDKLQSMADSLPSLNELTPWEDHLGANAFRLKWEALGLRRWRISRVAQSRLDDTVASRVLRRTWLWAASRNPTNIPREMGLARLDHLFATKLFATGSPTQETAILDALAAIVPGAESEWNSRERLEFFSMLQVALGDRRLSLPPQQEPPNLDALDGYRVGGQQKLAPQVRAGWEKWIVFIVSKGNREGDEKIVAEGVRTLALLEPTDEKTFEWLLTLPDDRSHPTLDLNTLCCIARCGTKRSTAQSERTAAILASTVRKIGEYGLNTENQWSQRAQQLVAALARQDTSLGASFVRSVDAYVAEDLALLNAFPSAIQTSAKEKMRKQLLQQPPDRWPVEVVRHALPGMPPSPELREAMRSAVKVPTVRNVALDWLSHSPTAEDYRSFLEGLGADDRGAWESSWKGIQSLPISEPMLEWPLLAKVALELGGTNRSIPLQQLLTRCRRVASACGVELLPTSEKWEDWKPILSKVQREEEEEIEDPIEKGDWKTLVARSKPLTGNARRGKALYEEGCLRCHAGENPLGPSLSGVAKRFSMNDLAVAIFEPSRDIPDRYRSTKVLTLDGDVYNGLVTSQSEKELVLLQGNGETVKIPVEEIDEQAQSTESLMPTGLLETTSPQDFADLLRYLQEIP